MTIKFEKITAGMVLYDRHSQRMGNTTMRTIGEWPVRVISVDTEKKKAVVVWNGNSNRPETYYQRELERLSTWSMYEDDVIVTRSVMFGRVSKVQKMTKAIMKAREAACTCDRLTAPEGWKKYSTKGHHDGCPNDPKRT